jgi:lipopolysaccharide transport system permease protein
MPSIIPQKYHALLMLNPMTGVIMGYQNVLVYDKAPDAGLLIYPGVLAVITMALAMVIFKKANAEMADVL